MNILVTGSKGFIGKNLIAELRNLGHENILEVDRSTDRQELIGYCKQADFVYHLAGANRPEKQSDFMEDNYGFTSDLLNTLSANNNNCPIMFASSIQATNDTPYGKSKKAGEKRLLKYHKDSKADVFIFRFPNVFGKWCKPNYNSVVATFCHNVAHDLPIRVDTPSTVLRLVYIDDLVRELIGLLNANMIKDKPYCDVSVTHTATLEDIVSLIKSFKQSRLSFYVPDLTSDFSKKMYSTYLSYLPENNFSYELKMNIDQRGAFTEFLKTDFNGQVSVNVSKPGVTKGNHWHHSKNEKFLVVSGEGIIRFRKIDSEEVLEYSVSGEKMEAVDIPVGYTHSIENIGKKDLVTVMWANEVFDSKNPDTYFLEV